MALMNNSTDQSKTASSDASYEQRMVEAAIDSAVSAIIIIDEAGTIQKVNPATQKIFGFAKEDLIGRNVHVLMSDAHSSAHDGYIGNYLRTGEQKIIGIGREVEARRKDGTIFPLHLSVGEFEADGKRYFVGSMHDLSARAMAEAESARQKTLFEAIFTNCPDALILSDETNKITLCNPVASAIFGYDDQDLTGKQARILFVSDVDYQQFKNIASSVMPKGHPGENIITFARADGDQFPGIAATADIVGSNGEIMGFLAVIRDVSRELAQEQALRQVQRMEALGQLTGGIAHDFNNLLTIITGNLELLDLDIEDAAQHDLLKRANDAALMGARLTDRLLTFARRRPLNAVPINLNDQLLGMMDLLRRTLGATINLASSLAPDLWTVRSDVSEIENAVLNLAINARDAMPYGGQLLIETSNLVVDDPPVSEELGLAMGDYVRLSVSDTGHGIEPQLLTRVFEPFFTTKEAGRGTGLGLSVIYGFAKQSGGRLTIYSEPGQGTTVNLYLPRAEAERVTHPYEKGVLEPDKASGEIVLVVEDQTPVREVTVKRLAKLGYNVREAESAVEAKALLEAGEKVDLVFSDIVMPGGMTGFDLADWLHDNHPEIPILLTSGFAENIAQGLAKEQKSLTVLRKPYSGEDLASAIRAALNLSAT